MTVHVLLGVDAAVGCQLVSLRQLCDALLQVLHLGVHGVNGLRRTEGGGHNTTRTRYFLLSDYGHTAHRG